METVGCALWAVQLDILRMALANLVIQQAAESKHSL
jgi:hypothetical protein